MATGLRPWIAATVAACGIVLLATLAGGAPPRPPQDQTLSVVAPRWGRRTGELAGLWRAAEFRRRLEVYRDRLKGPADSARAAGGTAPLLLIDGGATPSQRSELQAALADLWKQAAPLGFKVAVGLVIIRDSVAKAPGRDAPSLEQVLVNPYYLFPDSLHRGLCLAVTHEGYLARSFFDARRRVPFRAGDMLRWLKQGLGPCAFYGAFGIPGHEMGRWINGGGIEFLSWPQWWVREPVEVAWFEDPRRPPARQPINWWLTTYSFLPWRGLSCYAERAGACAADVFDSTALSDSQPAHWSAAEWWRGQPLFGSMQFMSDVAQDIGAERFSELWSTDVRMDSAFHLATGRTLDAWTRSWARRSMPPLPLGAAAPPLDILTGLLPALIALGAALWYARRRQIG